MEYVIIGCSAAGLAAAGNLRRFDPGAGITVVDADPHAPYARCEIPRVLAGRADLSGIALGGSALSGVNLVRERAVGIDGQGHLIKLQSGREIKYDKLLLATGASPVKPDLEHAGRQGVFTMRTFGDVNAMLAMAPGVRRAVVLGGGLVGVKGALALRHRGIPRVTLVMKSSHLLSRQLNDQAASFLEQELASAGVTVVRGVNPLALGAKEDQVTSVSLEGGRELAAELVLFAKGVRPNVDLALNAGAQVGQGIAVNKYLQTSLPDIYAAGDCIKITDVVTGTRRASGLWPLAMEQGRYAAMNMAGRWLSYPVPLSFMNAARFGGLAVISVGPVDLAGDEVYSYGPINRVYRRLVFRQGRLISAILTGAVDRAGVYTGLIKTGRPVDASIKQKLIDGTVTAADLLVG